MRVVILESAAAASAWAARQVAEQIRVRPDSVLGLATGGTPVACYRELIELHRNAGLDFSRLRTFNLDEYVGLPEEHPQSYRQFMQEHLFDHVNLPREQTSVPNGMAEDVERHCQEYEQAIAEAGGIDLQLLGIGTDGHIAFNEPGSSLSSRTRMKALAQATVHDNARFFGSIDEVPRLAITMGVGTILESRVCLLLATGANKAEAVRAAIEGPVSARVTASALQLHRRAVFVLDEPAAGLLEFAEDYREAERVLEARG